MQDFEKACCTTRLCGRKPSACADLESFVWGSNFDVFFFVFFFLFSLFLVDEGREDPNTTISGPSSARQRNAIKNGVSLADDGPTGLAAL